MIKVHSIETFWTHEWPWIRVVVFMQWCLMKCLYCHNPDTIKLSWWDEMTKEDIVSLAEKSKTYFGENWWLTFSGWECLLQANELIPIFKELKKLWYNIAIDTNWHIFNENVKKLLKYTDLVLLDIKHIDNTEHKKLTWVGNEKVLNFAKYLEKINKNFWVRHVLLPWYTDDEKHLNDLWNFLKDFKNMERFEFLPYHTLGVYKWKELWIKYKLDYVLPPNMEDCLRAKSILEKYMKNVFIRR